MSRLWKYLKTPNIRTHRVDPEGTGATLFAHTRTHAHAHAHAHTGKHTQRQTHTCATRARTQAHAHTCVHIQTHAHAHTHAHTRTHTHTQTHTHTHTHTHKHTHTDTHLFAFLVEISNARAKPLRVLPRLIQNPRSTLVVFCVTTAEIPGRNVLLSQWILSDCARSSCTPLQKNPAIVQEL